MKVKSDLWYERTPERKLNDIILPDSIRLQIKQLIKEQHQSAKLHEYNLRASSMVIISGETGNGKTLLAEAIAYELMYPIIKIRYDKLIGCNAGETFSRFCKVLDYAKTEYFVMFIDAFEIFGKNLEYRSAFLSIIDEVPDSVIIIAENSHGCQIPKDVSRRFNLSLYLPEPTQEQKIEYIASIGRRCGVDFSSVPMEILDGNSFAEIERRCLEIVKEMVLSI